MSRKTSSRSSLGVVEKLIEQRRLFQDWLAKLDSGVEAMPPRVVERVRNDYAGRLQKVLAELADQQDAVREALAEAEAKHADLEAQQTAKREELAELKLRRHVGEVEDGDFKESNALLKQAIDGLSKELGAALRDIERFEEILEAILHDQAPPAEPEPEPEPQPESAEPEAAAEEQDEGEIVIPMAEPEPEPASEPEPEAEPEPAAPARARGDEDELAFLRSVTTTMPPVKPRGGRAQRADRDQAASAADEVTVEPSPSRKSLEMEAPDLDEPPGELEAAAHMVDLPSPPADEPPPAARARPEAGEDKGLVCAECGTTNRATEWYCSKCGAELSAV